MSYLKSVRIWLLLLIGSVLASVIFFLSTNSHVRLMPKRFELSGTDADLRIKDVFLTEDKRGTKAWELRAENRYTLQDKGESWITRRKTFGFGET